MIALLNLLSVAASLALAGRKLSVVIINVSDDGCQISCEEMLPIGAGVGLQLELVGVSATVRGLLAGNTKLRFVK